MGIMTSRGRYPVYLYWDISGQNMREVCTNEIDFRQLDAKYISEIISSRLFTPLRHLSIVSDNNNCFQSSAGKKRRRQYL